MCKSSPGLKKPENSYTIKLKIIISKKNIMETNKHGKIRKEKNKLYKTIGFF